MTKSFASYQLLKVANKKSYLSCLLLIAASFVHAQTSEEKYMNPQSVLGIWETADSAQHRIEFRFYEGRFILASDTTLSGRHQFNSYEFFRNDSLTVSTTGVIIRWPPDHCDVKLLDENNIEIWYGYATSAETTAVRYKRVAAKE